jgi:hypothetical protein
VVIKFSTPKEATMHRRKRRILKSLVLGFAVAAIAAPTAAGDPRDLGIGPSTPAEETQGVFKSPDDRSIYRGTAPVVSNGADDRSIYRGTAPLPSMGSDDRAFARSVIEPTVPPTVQLTVSSDDGFQWSDAGFGAASTLAFVLLLGATTLVIRHQRRRIVAF